MNIHAHTLTHVFDLTGQTRHFCLFYHWTVQVFIRVTWHLDGMNSKRHCIFPLVISAPAGAIFRRTDSKVTNIKPPGKFFYIINISSTCSSSSCLSKYIQIVIMRVISLIIPLKMATAGAKSAWREKHGSFLNSFHPDFKWFVQRLQQINYEIGRSSMSVLFNQKCLKEKMLHAI